MHGMSDSTLDAAAPAEAVQAPPEHVEAPRRRRAAPLVALLVALLLLVVCPLVGVLLWVRHNDRMIEDQVAALRAAGEPITPEDMEAFYALAEGADNVTALLLSASAAFDTEAFNQQAGALPIVGNGTGNVPPPGQPWPQQREAEALLARYAAELGSLHEAARRGGAARYPTNFRAGFGMLLEHVQRLRGAARMLSLEAHVRARRGDHRGAAQSMHAIVMLARSLEREPIVISQLVRIAVGGVARGTLEELLPHLTLADEDLRLLQDAFLAADYADGFHRAIQGERAMGLTAFRDLGSAQYLEGSGVSAGPQFLWRLTRGEDCRMYLDLMAAAAEAAAQPEPQARAAFHAASDEVQQLAAGGPWNRARYMLTLQIVPALDAAFEASVRGTAQSRTTGTALAAERYRLQHGAWPESLDRLAPDFLPVVPIDPYDGQALRYVRREGEAVVYSVGANATDDGGQEDPSRPGEPDVTFHLRLDVPAAGE
jgi:hypothetical protein